jgi:hypothetical protein
MNLRRTLSSWKKDFILFNGRSRPFWLSVGY